MKPKDFYNKTADVYDVRHDSPATRLVRAKEKQLIKKFAFGKALDFGCGTGYHLHLINDIIGADISEKMLKKATTKKKTLILSDENLPIKEKSIETIFCFLTVLNMCDHEKVIKEFARILKPKGRVLLSLASVFDNNNAKTKTVKIYNHKMSLHLFTKKEILRLFEKNGFSVEFFDSIFILQKPQWGNFRSLSIFERLKLLLERSFPKEKGAMYFLVFKKI